MLALSVALLPGALLGRGGPAGRIFLAAVTAAFSLALAGWVGVTIVPALARRSSLRWIAYQVDYRLTRDGIIYLGAVFILILAAVNTGNNLLFMILGCCLAGILISGVLSRAVLTGVELNFDLPERIFAEQPVLAEIELRNEKQLWPSFSLRVVGERTKNATLRKFSRSRCFSPTFAQPGRGAAENGAAVSRAAESTGRTRLASAPAFLLDSSRRRARSVPSSTSWSIRASSPPSSSMKCCRC